MPLRKLPNSHVISQMLPQLSVFAVKIVSVILGFISTIILSRFLTPDQFGSYSLYYATAVVVSMFGQIGLPQYVFRATAQKIGSPGRSIPKHLWQWSFSVVLLISATLATLTGLVRLTTFAVNNHGNAFLIALSMTPIIALIGLQTAKLRGLGYTFLSLAPDTLLRPLTFIGIMWVTWLWGFKPDSRTAILAQLIGVITSFIFTTYCIELVTSRIKSTQSEQLNYRMILRSAAQLGTTAGLFVMISNVDILLLGLFATPSEVAVYRIASSLAGLVTFGLVSINYTVAQKIAVHHHNRDFGKLGAVCKHSARSALGFAVPVGIALIASVHWIAPFLFGAKYVESQSPLIILAGGLVVNAFFATSGIVLEAAHQESPMMKAMLSAFIIGVFLHIILIPALGARGAAIATSVTLALYNVSFWYLARKLVSVDTSPLGLRPFCERGNQ